ncbi:MAG: hypothetical protein MI747_14770 [Desulfobacterales bacterium]|nr:hypothetical protein [Desulfobacterales bacterium]
MLPPQRVQFTMAMIILAVCLQTSPGISAQRILVLETMTAPIVQEFTRSFIARFNQLHGSRAPKIIKFNAQGDGSQARAFLARESTSHPPDLVVSVATLAAKASKAMLGHTQIPQVFMCVTDPVGAGLIPSLDQAADNMTGKAHYIPAETKINMILKILGPQLGERPIRFGYIYTDYPADLSDYERLQDAARTIKNIVFVPRKIAYQPIAQNKKQLLEHVRDAARELQGKIDYFWSPRGVLAVLPDHDKLLLDFPQSPLLVGATENSVKMGALVHITGDPKSQARDVATLCHAILNGKSPGDIAPSLPRDIQFSVNLKTAIRLNMPIPSDILELAKGHIHN